MKLRLILCGIVSLAFTANGAAAEPLTGKAADLYQQAIKTGRHAANFEKTKHEIRPTNDGRSFFVIWKGSDAPTKWIVSLHGAGRPAKGFATDDLAIWYPHLKDRTAGLICLQWWFGTGDRTEDFYTPMAMYREIDQLLAGMHIKPGTVMLHGFSRGSANTYALAALDAGRGPHYFSLIVASSGGAALDYPPTRAIGRGEYGQEPLRGTKWITVAGARDPEPDRDGIAGMKRTAGWLKDQGAVVAEQIEDPNSGHGALVLNPKNAARVLDRFLNDRQP